MDLDSILIRITGDATMYNESLQAAINVSQQFGQTVQQVLVQSLQGHLAASAASGVATAKLTQDVDKLQHSLEMQVATLGMTGRQAQIYALQLRGATDAQLQLIKAADATLTTAQMSAAEQKARTQAQQSLDRQKQRETERAFREEQAAIESLGRQKQRAYEADLAAQQRAADLLARQKQRAYEADLRAQQKAEEANNRRIRREIEAETKKVIAAAKAREAAETSERSRTIGTGQGVISDVVSRGFELASSAVNEFAQFDLAMVRSTSIMKVTQEEILQMRETALSLSQAIAFSPTSLAETFYFLASSGMDAQRSMAALPAVIQFATAGSMNLAQAANYAVAATTALGLASKDADVNMRNMSLVMDTVTKASKIALGTTEQYAKALTRDAAAALKSYHIELSTGVAVLTAYHNAGLQGAIAGNTMGRAIRLLAGASVTAAKAHREFNFQVYEAGTGKIRNMADIIENLETVLSKYDEAATPLVLRRLGFETLAQKAIIPLIGQSAKIREAEAELKKAGGITEVIARRQMQAFSNQMEIISNQITVASIKLGQEFVPVVKTVATAIGDLARIWSGTAEIVNGQTKQIGGFSAEVRGVIVIVAEATLAFTALSTVMIKLPAIWAAAKAAWMALSAIVVANPYIVAAAGIAVLTVAIVKITETIIYGKTAMQDFNEQMELHLDLQARLGAARAEIPKTTIEAAEKIKEPEARREFLAPRIKSAEADLHAREREVREKTAKLSQVGFLENLGSQTARIAGGETVWQEANRELKEAKQRLDEAKKGVKELQSAFDKTKAPTKEDLLSVLSEEIKESIAKVRERTGKLGVGEDLSKVREFQARGGDVSGYLEAIRYEQGVKAQIELTKSVTERIKDLNYHIEAHKNGLGDTTREVEFYKLAMSGASQVELLFIKGLMQSLDAFDEKEKLMKKGIETTKSLLNPAEKYQERVGELNKLLKGGAITQETYTRGVEKAAMEVNHVKNETVSYTNALYGSVAAIKAIERQRDMLAPYVAPFIPGGGLAVPEKDKPKYAIPATAAFIRSGLFRSIRDSVEGSEIGGSGTGKMIDLLTRIAEALTDPNSKIKIDVGTID